MNLSIVIPVYNSGEIISALVEKISDHIKSNNLSTEIILVNDFSKDSSWKKIKILHRKYSYVKGINLEKYRPKYIVVEIFTLKRKTFDQIKEYMDENNYKLLERIPQTNDYIFCDNFLNNS